MSKKQICFYTCFRAEKICFHNMFVARLNSETFASTTFPSLARPLKTMFIPRVLCEKGDMNINNDTKNSNHSSMADHHG